MVWGFETDPEILAELRIGHPVILEVRCGLALGKVVRISGRKVHSLHKTVSCVLDSVLGLHETDPRLGCTPAQHRSAPRAHRQDASSAVTNT